MKEINLNADFAVIGGGVSGVCAAIAAARNGASVVLMHDRPVLGGNASSEVRMWICGAHGDNLRESGLLEEMLLENLYRNPESNYSIWDSVMYSMVIREKNIKMLLNTTCQSATMDGNKVTGVRGWQINSETYYNVSAKYFSDCSGDSILVPLTGAESRYGREARAEFGESIAPEEADRLTMGMSCLIQARETTEPRDFIAPEWAYKYKSLEDFPCRNLGLEGLQNFWWLELGGMDDALHNVDSNREELLKIAFGIWDFHKNSDVFRDKYRNWELEWVGYLPGKRESRRYVGDHIMNQNDVSSAGKFHDTVGYGGWTMDDHHPEGLRYPGKPTIFHPAPSPYGIPYRSLYSRNIDNLFCAGRNISTTHSAMSSTRVMATCGVLGQAVGTAAAIAVREKCSPREVGVKHLDTLQQTLMKQDAYLPEFAFRPSGLAASAKLAASAGCPEGIRKGVGRIVGETDLSWTAPVGSSVEYTWDAAATPAVSRIIFDSNLSRPQRNLIAQRPLNFQKLRVPETLVKRFKLEYRDASGNWQLLKAEDCNWKRYVETPVNVPATGLRLTILESWGNSEAKVFAWDFE